MGVLEAVPWQACSRSPKAAVPSSQCPQPLAQIKQLVSAGCLSVSAGVKREPTAVVLRSRLATRPLLRPTALLPLTS